MMIIGIVNSYLPLLLLLHIGKCSLPILSIHRISLGVLPLMSIIDTAKHVKSNNDLMSIKFAAVTNSNNNV